MIDLELVAAVRGFDVHFEDVPIPGDYGYAATQDSYDGDGPVGRGGTRKRAIADLLQQIEE